MTAYTPLDYPTLWESIWSHIEPKKDLITLVILSILIRIPRVPGMIGDDAFVVLWMGRILSEGHFENWMVSPFSLFGVYPFASYPIGIPLVVAIMLNLSFSFETIAFVVSTTAGVVGTVGAYLLGGEIFRTKRGPFFFTVFYSFSSVFINFTYYTITPRGPFLAVLPCFLFYSVKYMTGRNDKSWKLKEDRLILVPKATTRDIAIASILFAVLFFIHGLALFSLLYAAVVIGYYIVRWLLNNRVSRWLFQMLRPIPETSSSREAKHSPDDEVSKSSTIIEFMKQGRNLIPRDWTSWVLYLVLICGALVLGLLFVPIDPSKTTPFLFSNDTLIGKSWNLIVDYGIRLGLLSIFLPFGILGAFKQDQGTNRRLVHYILVPLVLFILPLSLYTSVLFLPVFGYYSVVGLELFRMSFKDRWVGLLSVVFATIFVSVYTIYAAILPVWTIGLVMSIVIIALVVVILAMRRWSMYHTTIGRRLRSLRTSVGQGPVNFLDWQGIRIFLISVIIISLITTEGILLQGDFKYVTNDERQIIVYLQSQPASGIIFVPTPVLGRRLEAYGFIAVLSFNIDATLYYGWIEPSNITSNSHFSILNLLLSGRPFVYDGPNTERILWNQLFDLDLTITSNRDAATALGLEYVIVEKTASGYRNTFYSIYGEYFSPLLESTPLACNRVFDGRKLSLFRIPTE